MRVLIATGGALHVTDPMNPWAEPLEEIEPPLSESGYSVSSFSADWRHVVWTTESNVIRVGGVDPAQQRYVPSFGIKPSRGNYSTASTQYENPRFSPDGETLWLEASAEDGETITLASVPYADPGQGDEPEPSNLKVSVDTLDGEDDWWTFDQNGDPMLTRQQDMREIGEDERDEVLADYWTDRSGSIVKLEIGAATHPEDLAYLGYDVMDELGPNEFVVSARPTATWSRAWPRSTVWWRGRPSTSPVRRSVSSRWFRSGSAACPSGRCCPRTRAKFCSAPATSKAAGIFRTSPPCGREARSQNSSAGKDARVRR